MKLRVSMLLFFVAALTGFVPIRAQVCTPPPSGIVAWWPGDGNANDIIGGNNGTMEGTARFAPGKVGLAFSLNGAEGVNAVNLGDVPAFDFKPSSSFTI
jgi:hypothetical protein